MKKFSILIFIFLSIAATGAQNEDDVFRDIAKKVSDMKVKMKSGTIAILPFETHGFSDSSYGIYVADKISQSITRDGRLTLVERERLDNIMREKELSMSGVVEQEEAAKLASLLSIDSILIGRVFNTEKGINITAKLVDSRTGAVLTLATGSYNDRRETSGKKRSSGFTGKWNVVKTAPYLIKQDMNYEKLILNEDGSFSLHLINNADRDVEIQGTYRITGNNIDYRAQKMFFDGNNVSFMRVTSRLYGTIYIVNGQLYFNYAGTGKERTRLDAMEEEYRCVAERRE